MYGDETAMNDGWERHWLGLLDQEICMSNV